MTIVKFEILSDETGLFDVDSLSCVDQQLNCHVTQDQYASIILKINQRMKKFTYPTNLPCLIGSVIMVLIAIKFVILQITFRSYGDFYSFLITGFFLISIVGCMAVCCATCGKCSHEKKEQRFRRLQSDIQKIADEEFMTIYQIGYSKWTIEKVGNSASGKKFKLTAEFRLPQPRLVRIPVPSVREPIDWTSIQLDAPTSASGIDLEQITTPLNNEQHSTYAMAPATPPPPSYHKVVYSFSRGIFTDCPNCGVQNGVFNEKYCTQCGYSLLI